MTRNNEAIHGLDHLMVDYPYFHLTARRLAGTAVADTTAGSSQKKRHVLYFGW